MLIQVEFVDVRINSPLPVFIFFVFSPSFAMTEDNYVAEIMSHIPTRLMGHSGNTSSCDTVETPSVNFHGRRERPPLRELLSLTDARLARPTTRLTCFSGSCGCDRYLLGIAGHRTHRSQVYLDYGGY